MTLAAHHHAMLHTASAIAEAVIAARGYVSLDHPAEVEALGFPAWQAKTAPALAIPLWNVHGEQSTWQLRPDSARLTKGKKPKLVKYETMAESRLQLDVHPSVQPLLGDPRVPLWVTEGVKKGDALVSAGACTVALMGGVWGFLGTNEHGGKGVILTDWQSVALNGRTVIVAYDSDLATNAQVEKALQALCAFLRSRQAIPTRVCWPEAYQQKKWGVDDFLADNKTLDDLLAMVPSRDPVPSAVPPPQNGTAPPAPTVDLLLTKDRRPRGALANVLTVLADDARWKDVLGYNALSDEVTFLRCPPCYQEATPWKPRALEDHDDAEIASWMQRQHQVFTSTTVVHEAVQAAAHRQAYHPIRNYLHRLRWDGTPRLDRWLPTYCRAEDTPYTRNVGKGTLIGAVARVERPGSKVDTALVFIGPQGIGKSTTWRVLCGDEWFSDTLPDLHDKDAMQALRGKWIIELGELATLHRSEIEVIKRYLSATQDHYRPSYGRRARTFLRQNIFVGTTNKEDIFKDETGNRRFYPITLTGICDIEALERDRNQLWAEAAHRYRAGEAWHLDAVMTAEAAQVQAAHMEHDPWESKVLDYAAPYAGTHHVTTFEIMREALEMLTAAQWTKANSMRIAGILTRHGWQKARPRDAQDKTYAAYWYPSTRPPATTDGTEVPWPRGVGNALKNPPSPHEIRPATTSGGGSGGGSAISPYEIRPATTSTTSTTSYTHTEKTTSTPQLSPERQESPHASFVYTEEVVEVVEVVADRMNTSGNSATTSATTSRGGSRGGSGPTAAPCAHLDTSLQGAGLMCTRCGAALF